MFSRTLRFALVDDLSGLIFFFGFVFDFRESTSVSFFLRGTDVWTSTYLTLIGGGVGGFLKFKGTINSNATTETCSKKAMSMNRPNLAWLILLPWEKNSF